MNIKIDTTNKILTIEDSLVNMSDLITELDKLIPNWREYKLQGVHHSIQYVPNYIPYPTYPSNPFWITPSGDVTVMQWDDCFLMQPNN